MKKSIVLLAAALTLSSGVFAQSKSEKKAIESFLSQTSTTGAVSYKHLRANETLMNLVFRL
ncbi:MAG: hypothetical protein K2K93_10020, partial [Muribaculaceae bacterium]|nr:hypothetical protein [Muribaculaceae bacterium]